MNFIYTNKSTFSRVQCLLFTVELKNDKWLMISLKS